VRSRLHLVGSRCGEHVGRRRARVLGRHGVGRISGTGGGRGANVRGRERCQGKADAKQSLHGGSPHSDLEAEGTTVSTLK
jgi:hypothetical protein